ncbi:metallophosphoesterase family protein [Thiothrix subterranea]|uniref:metallophosphoesterase family protein n=1 Tax=Thiothrix subterranea TaxID=2735563 RepID=UPI00280B9DB1|nr:metallophosphoesterase [Thiothrix subterranea]
MNLTFISDTHSLHDRLPAIDAGDVLIHCGDFTGRGTLDDTLNFAEFMAAQPFTHKIVIAGNHDWCFEDKRRKIAEHILKEYGLIYLNDSGIEIDGVKFWGSPIQPEFCDWAFNRERGEAIRQHWDKIPADTDVLITHGPRPASSTSVTTVSTPGAKTYCTRSNASNRASTPAGTSTKATAKRKSARPCSSTPVFWMNAIRCGIRRLW